MQQEWCACRAHLDRPFWMTFFGSKWGRGGCCPAVWDLVMSLRRPTSMPLNLFFNCAGTTDFSFPVLSWPWRSNICSFTCLQMTGCSEPGLCQSFGRLFGQLFWGWVCLEDLRTRCYSSFIWEACLFQGCTIEVGACCCGVRRQRGVHEAACCLEKYSGILQTLSGRICTQVRTTLHCSAIAGCAMSPCSSSSWKYTHQAWVDGDCLGSGQPLSSFPVSWSNGAAIMLMYIHRCSTC